MALAAVLAVLVAGQLPASAHESKVFHGDDYALIHADHTQVALCDEEEDGHWIFALVGYGSAGIALMLNANGPDGDCVVRDFPVEIPDIKVCEEAVGCRPEEI